ncbi:MAG: hypothetical protein WC531_03115 [Candidatus Paceibacterota bacterium]|jgi:hypothetical protein
MMAFRELSIEEFRGNTGICYRGLPRRGQVVPLRQLATMGAKVQSVVVMGKEYLTQMLRSVVLIGTDIHPYEKAQITVEPVYPLFLPVTQTFVQRSKLLEFLERFDQVFADHHVPVGIAKKSPMIVMAKKDGLWLVAHYLPPIIEDGPRGMYLFDGQHRDFMCGRTGTTIVNIFIKGVTIPPRADLINWLEVKVVDEKPEVRCHNNHPELYRDLERVGIDG